MMVFIISYFWVFPKLILRSNGANVLAESDMSFVNISMENPQYNRVDFTKELLKNVSLTIENMNVSLIMGSSTGGAYSFVNPGWINSNILFRDSSFNNISSTSYGGVAYFNNFNSIYISNVSFSNCISGNDGGVFRFTSIRDLKLNDIRASNTKVNRYGSFGYFQSGTFLSIIDGDFNNGSAGYGGCHYINSYTTAILNNCSFDKYSASNHGGSLYFDTINSLSLMNCKIFNSTAVSAGGSLYINTCPYVSIINVSIIKSYLSSSGNGGALYSISNTNLDVINGSFENCSASNGNGGSLYIQTSNKVVVNNSIFLKSSAIGNGGSLYSISNSIGIDSTQFIQSYSTMDGGAIYHSQHSTMTMISNCQFVSCYSNLTGGAIYIGTTTLQNYLFLQDSTFYNCSSMKNGGAIFFGSLSSKIQRVCAHSCSSISGMGLFIYYYVNSVSWVKTHLEYVSIVSCHSITASRIFDIVGGQTDIKRINSSYNTAYEFAGFYLNPYISLTVDYCTFANNTASSNCYCFYIGTNSSSAAYVNNNNLIGNKSPGYYLICMSSNTSNSISILNSLFMWNTASTLFYVISNSTIIVSFCYLNHVGSLGTNKINYQATISTLSITKLIEIDHLSTYMCQGQIQISQNAVPCPTIIDPLNYIPPSPTSCDIISQNPQLGYLSLSSVLHFVTISTCFLITI